MRHAPPRPSMLNRLLEEISWEGSKVRDYRRGGTGRENVLTAEVLMPLDFLPRTSFLGSVLMGAHGADAGRAKVVSEVENLEIELLSELTLRAKASDAAAPLVVQPDALMVGPSTYVLVEAKRIKTSSFGPEQLPREYAALVCAAQNRTPLLLLLLGAPPPVDIRGKGRREPIDAVVDGLASLHPHFGMDEADPATARARVVEALAWITWAEIRDIVSTQHQTSSQADPSVGGTVDRLVRSLEDAIDRHS